MKLVIENNSLVSGVPESEHETLVIPDTVTEIGEKAFWRGRYSPAHSNALAVIPTYP